MVYTKTTSEEEKVNSISSNKLSTQILPVDTLLINQILPSVDRLRVPSHQVQRILDYAEIAPKSKTYFIVNRADLEPKQLQRLAIIENELNSTPNIQVIDFQQVLIEERFEHLKEYCAPFERHLKLPGDLHTLYTVSNEHRVKLSSYNELSTQILPEDTPLMFQWIPLSHGYSIPNTQKYPYLQRIVDWAEREPQRMIYLIVNGAGFKPGQLEKLETDFKPISNIKIVDYQVVSKKDGFKHIKICFEFNDNNTEVKIVTIPDLLCKMYDQPLIVKKVKNSNIIDAHRLEAILNHKMITSHENIIYLDLDILPSQDNKQIGPVSMPGSILFASKRDSNSEFQYLENSIIAVNSESPEIVEYICKYVECKLLDDYHEKSVRPEIIHSSIMELINLYYYHREQGVLLIDEVLKDQQAFKEYEEKFPVSLPFSWFNTLPKEWYDQFCFDKNGGNLVVTSDQTWRKGKEIYSDAELPLYFNNAQDQTITASALPHLNYVDTKCTS